MATHSFSKSGSAIIINGITNDVPGAYTLSVDTVNNILVVKADNGTARVEVHTATDTVTVNSTPFSGTAAELKTLLLSDVFVSGATPTTVTVYQLKTILTDAQIKALPTTPVEVVPAPGVDKYVFVHAVNLNLKNSSGVYTNYSVNAGQFKIGQADNYVFQAESGPLQWDDGPVWWINGDPVVTIYNNVTKVSNLPIIISLINDTGNLTGGNAANTMEVTVFYSIVDL